MKYDAIVVGAGISGLLATLCLTKNGKNVLLIEKEGYVGGNARTYEVDGYKIDTGPHAVTYVQDGPLRDIINEYFDRIPEFIPYGKYYVRDSSHLLSFPWTILDWLRFSILPISDRKRLIKIMGGALLASSVGKVNLNVSMYEYLRGVEFSEKTWKFVDMLSYFMSGKSMHEMPAWRMLRGARYLEESDAGSFFQKFAKMGKLFKYDGTYHQGYPKNGVGEITDCIVSSIPKKKLDLKTDTTVESITVADGKVKSVVTASGSYSADLIVYSGFVKDLPSLVDDLPEDYTKNLTSLKQSTSVSIWLGFEEKLKELAYIGSEIWFESGSPYWGMATSNYNSDFAPVGKQLAVFSTFVEDDAKKAEEDLLKTVYSAIPSAEDNVCFKHVQVTNPEKAAITVGANFPNPKSPVDGLYLVGTDTDIRSMGITRAAFSVKNFLQLIKEDKRI